MAMKDWRKTYDAKDLVIFKNEKKNLTIELEDISGSPFEKNAWNVTGTYEDGAKFLHSGTKGKTNALKIAKNYMRTH